MPVFHQGDGASDTGNMLFSPLPSTVSIPAWNYTVRPYEVQPAWPSWPEQSSASLCSTMLDPAWNREQGLGGLLTPALPPLAAAISSMGDVAGTPANRQDTLMAEVRWDPANRSPHGATVASPLVTVSPPSHGSNSGLHLYARTTLGDHPAPGGANTAYGVHSTTSTSFVASSSPSTSRSERPSTSSGTQTRVVPPPPGSWCTESPVSHSSTPIDPSPETPSSTRRWNGRAHSRLIRTAQRMTVSDPAKLFERQSVRQEGVSSATSPLVGSLSGLTKESLARVHSEGEPSDPVTRCRDQGGASPSRKHSTKRNASQLRLGAGRSQLNSSEIVPGWEPLPLPTPEDGVITGAGNGVAAAGTIVSKAVPGKRGGGFSCHCCKTSKRDLSDLFLCTNVLPKSPPDCDSGKAVEKQKKCKKKYCRQCMHRLFPRELQTLRGLKLDQWTCPSCMNRCCCAGCERKITGEAEAPWRRNNSAKHEKDQSPAARKESLLRAQRAKKAKMTAEPAPNKPRRFSDQRLPESLAESRNGISVVGEDNPDPRKSQPSAAFAKGVEMVSSLLPDHGACVLLSDLSDQQWCAGTSATGYFRLRTPPSNQLDFSTEAPPVAQPHFTTDQRRQELHRLGINLMRAQVHQIARDSRAICPQRLMEETPLRTSDSVSDQANFDLEKVLLEKQRRLVEQQRITDQLLAQIQAHRSVHLAESRPRLVQHHQ
jgi:hypothetical protein